MSAECQLGKNARQEIMQLVGQPRGLARLAFEAAGDLTQGLHGRRQFGSSRGMFVEREAGHGEAVNRIGLALGVDGLAVLAIAGRFADRDGRGIRQPAQERFEVGGVLAGGVDADVEVGLGVPLGHLLKSLLQLLVALGGLGKIKGLAGRLQVGVQEGDVVGVACGVEADADAGAALGCRGGGHEHISRFAVTAVASGREGPPLHLRHRQSL